MTVISVWPDVLFDRRSRPRRIALVAPDGFRHYLDTARWNGGVSSADRQVLARVDGPVLDVGCGPGRLAAELTRRGEEALGIDSSMAAVRQATRRGASVSHGSIFEAVPRTGAWGTILLLDGNIGIGGDPARLLRRCAQLLRRNGRILIETEPPGPEGRCGPVRVDRGTPVPSGFDGTGRADPDATGGPWFAWAVVSSTQMDALAAVTGFTVTDTWSVGPRWFTEMQDNDRGPDPT